MKRNIQAAAVVVCLLVTGLAYGLPDELTGVLKGLRSLQVVLDVEVGDLNLRESDIRRDVALKLELAGIKVLGDDTGPLSTLPPGALPLPRLYVGVFGFELSDSGAWVVTFRIELLAAVITTLDWQESRTITWAELWSTTARLLSGPKSDMARRVRDDIKDGMDDFLLDYVRANRAGAE